eukprot:Colp12_sorted_trinity150504_noHs@23118
MDTLGMLLAMSNARAGSKILTVDTVCGLLVGSVLDRLGGHGRVLNLHPGSQSGGVEAFNLPPSVSAALVTLPLNHVSRIKMPFDQFMTEELARRPTDELREKAQVFLERRRAGHEMLQEGGLDGLVIASKYHPEHVIFTLLPFLAPSRPFAIYCTHKEALLNSYLRLRREGYAVNVQLAETWYRELQVLPQRTHPHMSMSATGGYVLSGITVVPPPDNSATDSNPAKRRKVENESSDAPSAAEVVA